MVGFTGNQRLLGEAAKTQEVMNLRNTITDIRRMLGRSLAEEDVEAFERPHLLYDVVATEDGSCGAKVRPTFRRPCHPVKPVADQSSCRLRAPPPPPPPERWRTWCRSTMVTTRRRSP